MLRSVLAGTMTRSPALQSAARFIAFGLLCQGCLSMDKDSGAGLALESSTGAAALHSSTLAGSGFAAFESSFYAFARTNCAECHSNTQYYSYAFAASDART